MKLSAAIILLLFSVSVFSQISVELNYFVGCFLNSTAAIQFEFNGELMSYVDFQRKEVVYTVPSFIDPDPAQVLLGLSILRDAFQNSEFCALLITMAKVEKEIPAEEKEPPECMIFPTREVEPGVENSLICFVDNFFPPYIKVNWTKNGQPVYEGVSLSRYISNKDQTFRQLSTLTFQPSEGDIYSCSVEHSALEMPTTRIWEVEFIETDESLGPDIFCGVGLALGLLGISIGTFFIVKGHHAQ
ncbi:unnamed protein product [Menidia menidia]|uniref:(Atlantic silverside) hypothetical protein n=1 Tax=Menidia menidia TaxID=238744 RepID=A0A8S4BUE4_9TELE|nr:unnamed protein product [Menidia menidia]